MQLTNLFVMALAAGMPIASAAPVDGASGLDARHHKGLGAAGMCIKPPERHFTNILRVAKFEKCLRNSGCPLTF